MEVINGGKQKLYTFKKLDATDVAPMCAVIGKIGIDKFTKCFESADLLKIFRDKTKAKEAITNLAGIKVALDIGNIVVSNYPACEEELFVLLAKVSDKTVDEIKAFSFPVYMKMIVDFFKKEEFRDFFKVASELFN